MINPSNHSIILLFYSYLNLLLTLELALIKTVLLLIAIVYIEYIANYNNVLNQFLGDIAMIVNCNFSLDTHKRGIDK